VALYCFDLEGTIRRASLFSSLGALLPWDQRLLPGRKERLQALKTAGHRLAAVSNQGACAFGLLTLERAERISARTNELLGGVFDAIYLCPHHPRGWRAPYNRDCPCRKPAPGMLLDAMQQLGASVEVTTFVGDRPTDAAAARAAGVRFVPAAEFFA
jgi:D-glycero-D-manno-heptose 1,7-bisphosphate phosphatase